MRAGTGSLKRPEARCSVILQRDVHQQAALGQAQGRVRCLPRQISHVGVDPPHPLEQVFLEQARQS